MGFDAVYIATGDKRFLHFSVRHPNAPILRLEPGFLEGITSTPLDSLGN